jgi:hypothetical protein
MRRGVVRRLTEPECRAPMMVQRTGALLATALVMLAA